MARVEAPMTSPMITSECVQHPLKTVLQASHQSLVSQVRYICERTLLFKLTAFIKLVWATIMVMIFQLFVCVMDFSSW